MMYQHAYELVSVRYGAALTHQFPQRLLDIIPAYHVRPFDADPRVGCMPPALPCAELTVRADTGTILTVPIAVHGSLPTHVMCLCPGYRVGNVAVPFGQRHTFFMEPGSTFSFLFPESWGSAHYGSSSFPGVDLPALVPPLQSSADTVATVLSGEVIDLSWLPENNVSTTSPSRAGLVSSQR